MDQQAGDVIVKDGYVDWTHKDIWAILKMEAKKRGVWGKKFHHALVSEQAFERWLMVDDFYAFMDEWDK